jgi:hypothetical protein
MNFEQIQWTTEEIDKIEIYYRGEKIENFIIEHFRYWTDFNIERLQNHLELKGRILIPVEKEV